MILFLSSLDFIDKVCKVSSLFNAQATSYYNLTINKRDVYKIHSILNLTLEQTFAVL